MKLKLGFSTCPNDTFIFAPIVHKKIINTKDFEFDLFLADVEELNKMAFTEQIEITKISFHAYAYIHDKFKILNSGSALGRNNGPLVIAKKKINYSDIPNIKIAIPGKYTTANLLLQLKFGNNLNTVEYLFSDIPKAILENQVDAGVIIHETRFTYQKLGLQKIIDLGEFWEEKTGLPVPLGGIIISRKLDKKTQFTFDNLLKSSILHSLKNPYDAIDFIRKYAQEISDQVMFNHINLYVNDYTVSLGQEGKQSIETLLRLSYNQGLIPDMPQDIFV